MTLEAILGEKPHDPFPYQIGDRITLVYTDDQYTDLVPGDTGVVRGGSYCPMDVTAADGTIRRVTWQVWVDWDNGSRLNMSLPHDELKVLEPAA